MKPAHFRLGLLLLACASAWPGPAARAGGTRADYDRAASFGRRTAGGVTNESLRPTWAADGNSFRYEADTPSGKKAWVVDAVAGTRREATEAEKTSFAPNTLPDLGRPARSQSGGESCGIAIENRTAEPADVFWLDDGGEKRAYGRVAAGDTFHSGTYVGHVWLATGPTGRTLGVFRAEEGDGLAVLTPNRATQPARSRRDVRPNDWRTSPSPDGRWTAVIRDRNVVLSGRDRREVVLTTDGTDEDGYDNEFFWSPDSRHLVVHRTVKGDDRTVYAVQSSPPDQLQPKLLSWPYLKPGDKIPLTKPRLFDVEAGKEIRLDDTLFNNPWDGDDHLRWDTDGRRFTFYYNQRGHQTARVLAVDATTGSVSTIVDEQAKTFIDYSQKFLLRQIGDDELIWASERDGWNHLYLYDAKAARVKNPVTKGDWVVRGVDTVDAAKRQIWFRAGGLDPKQDPYYVHYARVNFDGSGLLDLTPGDGTHTVKWSPDGRFYVDTYSRVDLPPVHELRRTEDGKLVMELERADAAGLLATGWRFPERFVAKGRDGTTDIYGTIVRPTNFDPSKKYPVIEDIYAGPHGATVPKAFGRQAGEMSMAELGFIVVHIDGMGTNYRSRAFHDYCWHNLADAGFPDRKLWIKAAAAGRPEMDLSKGVGIYGTSAGGQNALTAVELHNDFYTVSVADCGCYDNRMDKIWWNEAWMGWPVGPWYAEQSCVTNAPKLQGKLLLILGETDHNVDPASTMQVVNALIKADKDFDLLVIPNADHGQDGAYGDRRRRDFFVRHLLGVEPRG